MSRRAIALWSCLSALTLASPALAQEAGAEAARAGLAQTSSELTLSNVPGPDGGVAWGRAEGIVDARTTDVLAILQDYAQYAGLFPHFEKSRILSQRGTDAIVYLEAKILHGATSLWGQVRMSAATPSPDVHVVEAKLMKGKSNMGQFLARWEVRPLAGGQRTQVSFQLLVDPDLPVPDGVISSEMKKSAGQAFRALRKRADQRSAIATRPSTAM